VDAPALHADRPSRAARPPGTTAPRSLIAPDRLIVDRLIAVAPVMARDVARNRGDMTLAASTLTVAAVSAAVIAFVGWLAGLVALMVVARTDFETRHPRLARRLDGAVWISWVVSTAVLFGPALGLTIASLSVA
jgi:hypothetical protein